MRNLLSRRTVITILVSAVLVFGLAGQSIAADKKIKLRMAGSGSPTGTRAVALDVKFAPAVAEFKICTCCCGIRQL
jgi:hypothetical protein